MSQRLCQSYVAKLEEQIDCLSGIITRLPSEKLDWIPKLPKMDVPLPRSLGQVLGHLLQCLAGIAAVLYAVYPRELEQLLQLKSLPVNHFCGKSEALERIAGYRDRLAYGFRFLTDEDLARRIPTVFVPDGETVLTLLLGNFEHLVNHKHELFMCAKFVGVPLGSRDLYRFRTELASACNSVSQATMSKKHE
jgi:hypothetical protein